jgi:hypothetical protein
MEINGSDTITCMSYDNKLLNINDYFNTEK